MDGKTPWKYPLASGKWSQSRILDVDINIAFQLSCQETDNDSLVVFSFFIPVGNCKWKDYFT
jgi:hypothetical protein